jgi:hypothetical protein
MPAVYSHLKLIVHLAIGGPFCGLFWPKDQGEKWIVVAFKGTSPTNFSEFMVDATIAHQNASGFFGSGALHRGFYTSLVPGAHSEVNPYGMRYFLSSLFLSCHRKVAYNSLLDAPVSFYTS